MKRIAMSLVIISTLAAVSGCVRKPEQGDYLLTMCLEQEPEETIVTTGREDRRVRFDKQTDGRWCAREFRSKVWEFELVTLFEHQLGENSPPLFVTLHRYTSSHALTELSQNVVRRNSENWRTFLVLYKDMDVPVVRP
jgi:hypothetical protein